MPDRVAYPAFVLLTAGLVALALVWPQGIGARSPAPFGHPLAPVASNAGAAAAPDSLLGVVPQPPVIVEPKSLSGP